MQVMAIVLLLIALALTPQQLQARPTVSDAQYQPYERVWLAIRSDARLGNSFEWSKFAAQKGDSFEAALSEVNLDSKAIVGLDKTLHLYRLQEIDLRSQVGQLSLKHGDKLYLTAEDLLSSQ